MAFPQYTEESDLPLMPMEVFEQPALPLMPLEEESIPLMPMEVFTNASASEVSGDGSPPVAASTTPGASTESAAAAPVESKPAATADLGSIDWNTKGGFDTFRQRLRDVPAADRVALLQSLPKDAQDVGFAALPLTNCDDTIIKINKEKLDRSDPGAIARVSLVDAQGNKNRFDLEGATQPATIDPGEFTFTAPPGTTIVH
jgi:hypothetical protein